MTAAFLLFVIQFTNARFYDLYPKDWENVVTNLWVGLAMLYGIIKILELLFGRLVIAAARSSLRHLTSRQKEILSLFLGHNDSKKVPLGINSETIRHLIADEIIYAETNLVFRASEIQTDSHAYFKMSLWAFEYVRKNPELLVDAKR